MQSLQSTQASLLGSRMLLEGKLSPLDQELVRDGRHFLLPYERYSRRSIRAWCFPLWKIPSGSLKRVGSKDEA